MSKLTDFPSENERGPRHELRQRFYARFGEAYYGDGITQQISMKGVFDALYDTIEDILEARAPTTPNKETDAHG